MGLIIIYGNMGGHSEKGQGHTWNFVYMAEGLVLKKREGKGPF